jgi:hypothetical protein
VTRGFERERDTPQHLPRQSQREVRAQTQSLFVDVDRGEREASAKKGHPVPAAQQQIDARAAEEAELVLRVRDLLHHRAAQAELVGEEAAAGDEPSRLDRARGAVPAERTAVVALELEGGAQRHESALIGLRRPRHRCDDQRMNEDEPRWGEAPDEELIVELLAERYPIAKGERVSVEVDAEERSVALALLDGKNVYRIRVEYLRGAGSRDPWSLLVDALDSLFGTLIESNRAYRVLPSGDDVEFADAFLRVTVERAVPDLDRMAKQILEGNGHREDE